MAFFSQASCSGMKNNDYRKDFPDPCAFFKELGKLAQNLNDQHTLPSDDSRQITIDIKDFAPEEIVITIIDGELVVEGKRESKPQETLHLREFRRCYTLPSDVDPELVTSKVSTRGYLTIKVPKKNAEPVTIPINIEKTSK